MKKGLDIKFCDGPQDQGARAPVGVVRFDVSLPVLDQNLAFSVDVPDKRARLADIVPLAWWISDKVRPLYIERAVAEGHTVSCSKGCDSCCRVLAASASVPEVFHLLDAIQSLPPRRRQRVLRDFAAAGKKIAESDMAKATATLDSSDSDQVRSLGRNLSHLWSQATSPCPLLVDHACSMYEYRPIVCRDYMAVSPPEACTTRENDKYVATPLKVYHALEQLSASLDSDGPERHMVLILQILPWFQTRKQRSQRTWRAPAMVEHFLGILQTMAENLQANPTPAVTDSAKLQFS